MESTGTRRCLPLAPTGSDVNQAYSGIPKVAVDCPDFLYKWQHGHNYPESSLPTPQGLCLPTANLSLLFSMDISGTRTNGGAETPGSGFVTLTGHCPPSPISGSLSVLFSVREKWFIAPDHPAQINSADRTHKCLLGVGENGKEKPVQSNLGDTSKQLRFFRPRI